MKVAPKNPIGRLADNAVKALKDPRKTAEKVVEQAKGTAALGRMVAEHVGRSAASKAGQTAGAVVARVPGRAPRAESPAPLRPVPLVNEAGHAPEENRASEPARKAPAKQAPAKKVAKKAGPSPADVAEVVEAAVARDPNRTGATPVKKAAAKKPAKKAPAKKSTPGAKLPIKKAAPGDKTLRSAGERKPE